MVLFLRSSSRCLTTSRLATIRRHFPFKRPAQFLARPCGHHHCQSFNATTPATLSAPTPTASVVKVTSGSGTRTPNSLRSPRGLCSSTRCSPTAEDEVIADKENLLPSVSAGSGNNNSGPHYHDNHCSSAQSSPQLSQNGSTEPKAALALRVVDCKQCVKSLYLAMIGRFCPHALASSASRRRCCSSSDNINKMVMTTPERPPLRHRVAEESV